VRAPSSEDRLQSQRFEFKYVIREEVAIAVREFVRSYLEIDGYGATLPNLSYPVHSLYLDSPDLKLYRSTINGNKNRFKLRLRFYENRPNAPIYFEIKNRRGSVILKERGAVKREAAPTVLSGHVPELEHLVLKDSKQLVALHHFCQHVVNLQAKPQTHVAYLREAWLSQDENSVRVTMDRRVRSEICPDLRLTPEMAEPMYVFGNLVVLELKFTDRFPDWFKELVRIFGLMQGSAAKYVDGVTRLGADMVSRTISAHEHMDKARRRINRIDRVSAGTNGVNLNSAAGFNPELLKGQA
jgi:hypothetical protein